MSHQNRGDPRLGQQIRRRFACAGAQPGIQCRKRLIQQHQRRLLSQGAGQGNTLLLATGNFVWPVTRQASVEGDHLH